MKQLVATAVLLAIFSGSASADEMVRGYVRKDGTYVAPHMRSSPNNSPYDNYSTQGNMNPYTGKRGTESADTNEQNGGASQPYQTYQPMKR